MFCKTVSIVAVPHTYCMLLSSTFELFGIDLGLRAPSEGPSGCQSVTHWWDRPRAPLYHEEFAFLCQPTTL